ncbi:MAG TPA: hypothetical protein VLF43_01585 [Candidatus Saccharimonadales bacterium]|nr:hypothetical protein [Candidatus Saccharimonadales bacterium]
MRKTSSHNRSKNTRRRGLLIGALALLLGVAGAGAYYFAQSDNVASNQPVKPTNTVDYGPPTEEEKAETERRKEEITKDDGSLPQSTDLSVSIIRANQPSAGQPVSVRALVTGTSTGTCTVTLTKSGQPAVTKTVPVVFEVNSASCQGADIPAADFKQSGDYDLKLTVQTETAVSPPATQTVTVQK